MFPEIAARKSIDAKLTHLSIKVKRLLSVVDELEATITANLCRATRFRQAVLKRAFSATERPLNN